MISEPTAEDRRDMLAARDVLLQRWSINEHSEAGRAEVDALVVVKLAAEQRRDLIIGLPTGILSLPLLAALATSLAETRRVAPPGVGPTAVASINNVRRNELAAMKLGGVDVLPGVHARRLRHDGLACTFAGAGISVVRPEPGLLFVNPFIGWPPVVGRVDGPLFVDLTAARSTEQSVKMFEAARHWADSNSIAPLITFAPLTALNALRGEELTWPLDWPWLASRGSTYVDADATAVSGEIHIVGVDDDRIAGLERARSLLSDASKTHRVWSAELGNAARLARILIDLAVPCDVYDAHVGRHLGRTLAARRDMLEETSASDLPAEMGLFAETDWGPVRRGLLNAYEALATSNRKLPAIVKSVEDAMETHSSVEIVLSNATGMDALRTWLLSRGTTFTPADVAAGRVSFRTLNVGTQPKIGRASVLTGVPPAAQVWRLDGADLGSLRFVCYPREAQTVQSAVARAMASISTHDAAVERARTLKVLTRARATVTVPPSLRTYVEADVLPSATATSRDPFDFLDEPEVHARFEPAEEEVESNGAQPLSPVDVWRVEVSPAETPDLSYAIFLRPRARVDRVIGDEVVAVSAANLRSGVLVFGGAGMTGASLFETVRPFLDPLWGEGTRTWLIVWNAGLDIAKDRFGGSGALALALNRVGITIGVDAVDQWSSAYRIGPGDSRVVAAVGELTDNSILVEHDGEIISAMERARRVHRRLGRALAIAARQWIAGDHDAFARVEQTLGVDLADAAADLSLWLINSTPIFGRVPGNLVGRLAPVTVPDFVAARVGDEIFHPERTTNKPDEPPDTDAKGKATRNA